METNTLPLEGVKVVEMSTVVAGPTTARMLCSYGAEVIKVEGLDGDVMRVGGVLLVNSSLVDPDRKYRDDIKVIKVPATDIANKLDNHRGTNIIMLGALAGASDLYDVDHVRDGMNHYFEKKGKNNPKNVAAFDAGAEAAAQQI